MPTQRAAQTTSELSPKPNFIERENKTAIEYLTVLESRQQERARSELGFSHGGCAEDCFGFGERDKKEKFAVGTKKNWQEGELQIAFLLLFLKQGRREKIFKEELV